jgi:integrase/recombinase XerC
VLARMRITPADLINDNSISAAVPTFADYVPIVSAAVPASSRRAYGSYWKRILEQWGDRRLDEPTPSEIQVQSERMRANVVVRRNARGGRSAAEDYISAVR